MRQLVPAGDAGLEPGPETACRAYPVEAEEALKAWMASKALDEIWVSPAGWWYAAWMHRQSEIDRLQAQLAAQQAVVDAAREVLNTISVGRLEGWFHWTAGSCLDELGKAFRTLDAAQAAQPEGGRAV